MKKLKEKGNCKFCDKVFYKIRATKIFCSRECNIKCNYKKWNKEFYQKNKEKMKKRVRDYYLDKVHRLRRGYNGRILYYINIKERRKLLKQNRSDSFFWWNRSKALERDWNKCTLCNSTDNIIVHHIDWISKKTPLRQQRK